MATGGREGRSCDGCGVWGSGGRYGEKEFVGKWFCIKCWDSWERRPRPCDGCGQNVASGRFCDRGLGWGWYCAACMARPPAPKRPACVRCGQLVTVGNKGGHEWFCASCWEAWNSMEGRAWACLSPLDALFQRYGSDKSSVVHGYAKVYEALFEGIRPSVALFLEVGIGTVNPDGSSSMSYLVKNSVAPQYRPGASARAWRDYFPNAHVVSFDVDPDTMLTNEERITTYVCDSTLPETKKMLQCLHGPALFDVVIDDGDHNPDTQQLTLANLWPLVRPGGIYVVEDVRWRQGETHPLVHGADVRAGVLEALADGAPFLAMASIGQGKWGATSHNSNVLVLRRPRRVAEEGWKEGMDMWEVV